MEERRINKLHGCLIEDNRVPELIQKMGLGGGGLTPIEKDGTTDLSTITLADFTVEDFNNLKTGKYYLIMNLIMGSKNAKVIIVPELYVSQNIGEENQTEVLGFTLLDGTSAGLGIKGVEIFHIGLPPESQMLIVLSDNLPKINPTGIIYDSEPIQYLATSSGEDLGDVSINMSWKAIDFPVASSNWVDYSINIDGLSDIVRNIATHAPAIDYVFAFAFTVSGKVYTATCYKESNCSFTIINEDLSTTIVNVSMTFDLSGWIALTFKAVKDKADVTDTIKSGLTNISISVL